MRKIIAILILTFTVQILFAQLQWRTQCTRRPLSSINFVSPTTAFIFGVGGYGEKSLVYKSLNGGNNWSFPYLLTYAIGYNGGPSFNNLCFTDSLYGWAGSQYDAILKTTNGGELWFERNVDLNYYKIYTIYFINRNTGWIGGEDVDHHNMVAKSTNSGLNWSLICSDLKFPPSQIYMLNANKGFAIGWAGWDTFASTSNGGYNWNYFRAGDSTGQSMKKIFFLDSLHGWLLGWNNYICTTTNGGINWSFSRNGIWNTENLWFSNTTTGWITSTRRRIWKTINGGVNWSIQVDQGDYNLSFRGLYFYNSNSGWATCTDGCVIRTTNGGSNWFNVISPAQSSVYGIYFRNLSTGWTVGIPGDSGTVCKTTDGGSNWDVKLSLVGSSLNSIKFVNDNTGFIAGSGGVILKTINGGMNWAQQSAGNNTYNSISLINANTGWICGNTGEVRKTTNSGANWILQNTGVSKKLNSICTINESIIFAAADSGIILKSTNSGANWTYTIPLSTQHYKSIFFINISTGFVVGTRNYNMGSNRVALKTTNSGISWFSVINESIGGHYIFNSVYFTNNLTGYIVTSNGQILSSSNCGANWSTYSSPISKSLNCIFFLTENIGWIGGDNGTVLTTAPPIGININSSEIPLLFSLSQNYPNPFNPVTKINYQIPAVGQRHAFDIRLIIYDILGREIETLVNETQKPGSYEVTWDGSRYASGVYFYRLYVDDASSPQANPLSITKKMVLIK